MGFQSEEQRRAAFARMRGGGRSGGMTKPRGVAPLGGPSGVHWVFSWGVLIQVGTPPTAQNTNHNNYNTGNRRIKPIAGTTPLIGDWRTSGGRTYGAWSLDIPAPQMGQTLDQYLGFRYTPAEAFELWRNADLSNVFQLNNGTSGVQWATVAELQALEPAGSYYNTLARNRGITESTPPYGTAEGTGGGSIRRAVWDITHDANQGLGATAPKKAKKLKKKKASITDIFNWIKP